MGITGGPTEGRKVLAAKAQLPAVEARLVAKILDSQYKYVDPAAHRWQCPGADHRCAGRYLRHVPRADEPPRRGAVRGAVLEEEMARFARQGLRMVAAACKPASLDATTLTARTCRRD